MVKLLVFCTVRSVSGTTSYPAFYMKTEIGFLCNMNLSICVISIIAFNYTKHNPDYR